MNLAYMYSWTGKMCCSFAVAATQEFAAVASTSVAVVAGAVEEYAAEVDSFAVVEPKLSGSALEMVPMRSCCGLLAAEDMIEEVRSEVGFGCSIQRLILPWQAFEEAVPWVMVGIAGDLEAD